MEPIVSARLVSQEYFHFLRSLETCFSSLNYSRTTKNLTNFGENETGPIYCFENELAHRQIAVIFGKGGDDFDLNIKNTANRRSIAFVSYFLITHPGENYKIRSNFESSAQFFAYQLDLIVRELNSDFRSILTGEIWGDYYYNFRQD